MKILLTGRHGQVGTELERLLAKLGEVVATDRTSLDLAQPDSIRRVVRAARPEVIVNAAAYTAVDQAESEPDLAMRINANAPGILAEEAKRLDALFVHYSTDYVFDGSKKTPYVEGDPTNPLSVYGASKLAGELAVRDAAPRHLILRTAWVYAAQGSNFVNAILRKARAGEVLRVVDDQYGAPTWALDVATLSAALIGMKEPPMGTFHMSAAGKASWHEVALEIVRLAGLETEIEAIPSARYPAPAKRPRYCVLDNSALAQVAPVACIGHWSHRLAVHFGAGRAKAK